MAFNECPKHQIRTSSFQLKSCLTVLLLSMALLYLREDWPAFLVSSTLATRVHYTYHSLLRLKPASCVLLKRFMTFTHIHFLFLYNIKFPRFARKCHFVVKGIIDNFVHLNIDRMWAIRVQIPPKSATVSFLNIDIAYTLVYIR